MLKSLLQGKPLKHPLHPMLVHLPIALFPISLLLDIASYIWHGEDLVRGAGYTMLAGIISALIAAIPGLVDWLDIRADQPAKRTGLYHMILNVLALVLYVVSLVLRWRHPDVEQTPAAPFVLSLLGIAILMFSGYLGGILVYDDGVGVGRHRRHTDLPDRTLTPSVADSVDGWVMVASSEKLREKQTLRVEIASTVMTLARINGQLAAVQEFCTHRCGPLSEGAIFENGRIECPWHRSCFDLGTGKVTKGPAKIDLRTFEAREQDGQIWIRVPTASPA